MNSEPIMVYGARWCGDCYRAKMILDNHLITYKWIDIDQDPNAKSFVAEVNHGNFVVPTIVFPDGSILSEPSNSELREKIDLQLKT